MREDFTKPEDHLLNFTSHWYTTLPKSPGDFTEKGVVTLLNNSVITPFSVKSIGFTQ